MMPDMSIFLMMLGMLMIIGAFAGVLAGLLGVGGGIILVPAFFYVFKSLGYDSSHLMQICLGTSLATIIVTSVRSVMAHNRKGAVDWAILKTWAPGIVIGAVAGVALAANLSSTFLQGLFGCLGIIIGLWLGFGSADMRVAEDMPVGLTRAILSPLMGFLSVLMGIGGGSFGVPLMTLYNRPIHRAVATAAGFGVLIAVPSVLGFLILPIEGAPPLSIGAVNLVAFAVIIAMTLITTPYGVRLAHAMNPKPLRRAFAVFITLVALNMLRKALGW